MNTAKDRRPVSGTWEMLRNLVADPYQLVARVMEGAQ
jgi:hypothetical protein